MNVIVKDIPKTSGQVQGQINIEATLNVSPLMARRRVTGYLIDHVSDHLGGDPPTLIIEKERFLWQVPVMLYLTWQGKVGQVGEIEVDAQTGQLLIKSTSLQKIRTHAENLATCATS